MKAEIIPIGTEILLGNIIDTNSSFLASQLPSLGIDLYFISAVGDNQERLLGTLRRAWRRANLIITTGGLGPTQDDITREAIAKLVGEELKVDEELWRDLQSLFSQHHWRIPQGNIKQAAIIPSAQAISNSAGTAPGWWLEKENHIVVALPGPADEMRIMWEKGILPKLQQKVTGAVIISRTIKTFGLPEARIDELLAPLLRLSNPTLATYFKPDGIHLRLTVKAQGEMEARQMIAQRETEIRDIINPHIWGVDNDTLDSVVGTLLEAKNLSLATMESCTDGLLSNSISDSLESSAYFMGGLLACRDEAKVAFGVDSYIMKHYGKGSSQEAQAMAEVARKNLRADIGLAISGSINPGENSGNVFIGLNSDKFERVTPRTFIGNRSRIKQRAVYAALFELRKALLEEV
ncbi:MAG: competence/damage-inducible protein A [Dehalococcoidia bacterium]|nr:competence/damage-inducible protein A [Dehalococcoidia bacterium]